MLGYVKRDTREMMRCWSCARRGCLTWRRYRVSLSLAGGHGDVSVQAADGGKNQSAKIQRSVGGWGSSSRI